MEDTEEDYPLVEVALDTSVGKASIAAVVLVAAAAAVEAVCLVVEGVYWLVAEVESYPHPVQQFLDFALVAAPRLLPR